MIYIAIIGGFAGAGAVFALLRRLGQSSKSHKELHIV